MTRYRRVVIDQRSSVGHPHPQTWSQRFETALHPAIAQFNASIGFDIQLIEYDLTGSEAHAKMLVKTGILSPKKVRRLLTA